MSRMTLSIIAQFQDRASRGLKTLLRLGRQQERMQKAYGRATEGTARAQQRLARSSSEAGRAMGNESAAASRLRAALSRVNAVIRQQVSLRERLRRAGSLAREGAGRIGRAGAYAAGIYASVQASAASAASLVMGPAAQVEGYMVQLEALEGSAAKAKAAMDWIVQFAQKTPLELHQVIDAYAQLRTFGLDPTNGTMQALVDTMAMSGKGAEHLQGIILAVGQAWTKGKLQGEEALQLIERGVPVWDLLSKAMGKPVPVIQKLASKGKLGRDVIAQLIQLMGQRAAGASEKYSRTWNGMVSNMADMWFKFRLMVAHSGVFDFLKEKLRWLLDTFNQLEASGKLQQIAQQIGDSIVQGLKAMWQFGLGVWAVLQKVGAALSWAAEKLGGWNNLAMVLMALPIVHVLASFVSGIMLLGQALMMITPLFGLLKAAAVALAPALGLLATPVGLVVAGIAAVGAAIAGVIWYFDLWPSITAAVSAAWQGLVAAGHRLAAFFSGLPDHIAAAWQAFRQWLSQPFDPFPQLRQQVQAIIADVSAMFSALDIGALINPLNWPALIIKGLQAAIDRVRQAFAGIDLAEAGRVAMNTLWAGMKQVAASLLDWAKGLAGKIGNAFSSAISWTKNLAAKAGRAVSSMFSGGAKQPAAQPQARASGGPFSRGPLLVGERGPELIYASRSGWVAHNDNLRRLHDMARRTAASLAAVGLAGQVALAQPQITPVSPSPAAIAAAPARAGQALRAGETRVEVRYAPQITVNGNADPAAIRQALDAHLDDLLERLERRQRERARLEF